MCKPTVHEHIGYKLIKTEIAGHHEMETQQLVQIDTSALENIGGEEHQYVNYQ